MTENFKCILSLKVARHLLSKGFTIIDIEPSRKHKQKLAFIFSNTPELEKELSNFRTES